MTLVVGISVTSLVVDLDVIHGKLALDSKLKGPGADKPDVALIVGCVVHLLIEFRN